MKINYQIKSYCLIAIVLIIQSCKSTNKIPSTSTLRGTKWELKLMHGNQLYQNLLTQKITMFFDTKDTNSFTSFAGCNNANGKFTKVDNKITFESPATTRMTCPAIKTENEFLELLTKTNKYVIKSHSLYLYDKKDYMLAVFDAIYLKK